MQEALRRGSSLLNATLNGKQQGQDKAPPTFRRVHVGDDAKNEQSLGKEPYRVGPPATGPGHKTNEVVTSKYTALNFAVKNLWEQFHRTANVYFLGISILQCIKAISITGGTPTTLAPLTAVLLATGAKDGIEDFARHQADAQENSRMVNRLVMSGQRRRRSSTGRSSAEAPAGGSGGGVAGVADGGGTGAGRKQPHQDTERVSWRDVHVGDVLEISNRENIPADLVMLSCSNPNGTCFVMTSNLDGETNLKPRMISPDLRAVVAAADDAAAAVGAGRGGGEGVLQLAAKGAFVECDLPNQKLEHFDGALVFPGEQGHRMPLHGKNILLRGCQLRNTEWCRGVVVYTGRETKIQMNAAEPAAKSSSLKPDVDRETLRVLCVQILLCLVGGIYGGVRAAGLDVKNMHFMRGPDEEPQSPALVGFLKFWSFIIIFTNFVPISLLVTLDMVKVFQSKIIGWDRQIYYEAREFDGTRRPMPAQVRSSELNEDLGRVKHIFSDKTGTLTCNVMSFRKCSIRDQMFGLGTTEIGLNYRLRNRLPVPSVPPLPPGAKRTPHVNFIDPDFERVVGNRAHPLHAAAVEFFLHLALNHEVQPEQQGDGSLVYSASNPDEGALIYAASHFGHRFLRRDGKDVVVDVTKKHERPIPVSPSHKSTSPNPGGVRGTGGTMLSPPSSPSSLFGGVDGEVASGPEEEEEEEETFQILHTFPFTSERKRSSVVVRKAGEEAGGVVVFCKGADNVIFERLDPKKNSPDFVRVVKENIAEFTRDGLRTLLTTKTERSAEQYSSWLADFQAAETGMQGREAKLRAAMEVMEEGLEIQGVTAIEDKLQDGVPDALACLRKAGTKVWMLTGDKVDTAINIGHSCSLLNTDMTVLRLCADCEEEGDNEDPKKDDKNTRGNGNSRGGGGKEIGVSGREEEEEAVVVTVEQTSLELDASGVPSEGSLRGLLGELTTKAMKLASGAGTGEASSRAAIVVDTYALSGISQYGLESDFVFLCGLCTSVVCARVSPRQKSLVVGMVRAASPSVVTLSVGDGANDVPMLQSAHVGVGIHGLEGAQAVNNSDFSLGQFRFLKKLLLVHGRWSYRRICKVTVYMFYKNALLVLPQFFFAFLSLSSGQNFYYDLMYQSYNVFFTSLPIIALGVFDQDVTQEVALAHPILFQDGIQRVFLTPQIFWRWMGEGGLHAVIVTFLPMAALGAGGVLPDGRGVGLWGYGLVVFFCVVLVANGRVAMENKLWTVVFVSVLTLSLAVYIISWFFFSETSIFTANFPQISGMLRILGGSPWFWLTVIVTTFGALLPSYFGIAWSALFCTTRDVVGQEISSAQRRRAMDELAKSTSR